MRVLLVDGRWYLEGWCRRAEDVRLFRLDRVEALTVLDVAAEVPGGGRGARPGGGAVRGLARTTSWSPSSSPRRRTGSIDYYPVEEVVELPDDLLLVRLRVADDGWLRQLALRLGGALRVLDPPELAERVTAGCPNGSRGLRPGTRTLVRTAHICSSVPRCLPNIPGDAPHRSHGRGGTAT